MVAKDLRNFQKAIFFISCPQLQNQEIYKIYNTVDGQQKLAECGPCVTFLEGSSVETSLGFYVCVNAWIHRPYFRVIDNQRQRVTHLYDNPYVQVDKANGKSAKTGRQLAPHLTPTLPLTSHTVHVSNNGNDGLARESCIGDHHHCKNEPPRPTPFRKPVKVSVINMCHHRLLKTTNYQFFHILFSQCVCFKMTKIKSIFMLFLVTAIKVYLATTIGKNCFYYFAF